MKGNGLGFALLGIGVGLALLGHYTHIDKLADSGFSFIAMAGLALKVLVTSPKE